MTRARAGRPRTGTEIELDEVVTVRDLAAGGRGVARLADGRTVFLTRAFPGDVVRVKRGQAHASYVEAREIELLEPAAEREVPVCADEGRCGGCDWMALPLPAQRRHKVSILRQSLERVGRVQPERLPRELPVIGGAGLGYRRRVRLHLFGRRLGLYSAASHTPVEVLCCHVCAPELWRAVLELRALLADPATDEAWLVDIADIEVRWQPGAVRPSVHLGLQSGARPANALMNRLAEFADLGASEFVQVNAEVNRHLVDHVLRVARTLEPKTALDVYCGAGNFALPLAGLGVETLGVELNRSAIEAAGRAASAASLPATFRAGDARKLLADLAAQGRTFDLVVIDPPRQGAKGLGPLLSKLCQRALIMVSCDPVTLARDVADLEQIGFRLTRTTVLDMFPQTHHVESVTELQRAIPA